MSKPSSLAVSERYKKSSDQRQLTRKTFARGNEQLGIKEEIKKRKLSWIRQTLRKPPTNIRRYPLTWNPRTREKERGLKVPGEGTLEQKLAREVIPETAKRLAQDRTRWRSTVDDNFTAPLLKIWRHKLWTHVDLCKGTLLCMESKKSNKRNRIIRLTGTFFNSIFILPFFSYFTKERIFSRNMFS